MTDYQMFSITSALMLHAAITSNTPFGVTAGSIFAVLFAVFAVAASK